MFSIKHFQSTEKYKEKVLKIPTNTLYSEITRPGDHPFLYLHSRYIEIDIYL